MICTHDDCFTCPYEDCGVEYEKDRITPEQAQDRREYYKKYYQENKERISARNKKKYLQRKYGEFI